jgi:hypothetical protein
LDVRVRRVTMYVYVRPLTFRPRNQKADDPKLRADGVVLRAYEDRTALWLPITSLLYLGDWLTLFALTLLLSRVKQQRDNRPNGDKIESGEHHHTLEPEDTPMGFFAERKGRCCSRSKKKNENIQQRVFASGHPPNY